jgi:hypothetical protein
VVRARLLRWDEPGGHVVRAVCLDGREIVGWAKLTVVQWTVCGCGQTTARSRSSSQRSTPVRGLGVSPRRRCPSPVERDLGDLAASCVDASQSVEHPVLGRIHAGRRPRYTGLGKQIVDFAALLNGRRLNSETRGEGRR